MAGDQKRLGILRDFLRTLPMHDKDGIQRFNMAHWVDSNFLLNGKLNLSFQGIGYDALKECETAGCAYGWATVIPEFIDLGWKLDAKYHIPMIKRRRADDAGPSFFGISDAQQSSIIYGDEYDEVDDRFSRTCSSVHLFSNGSGAAASISVLST